MISHNVFLVKCSLEYRAKFLVSAVDIVAASHKAISIVSQIEDKAVIYSIEQFNIDLLEES
jgi:hypothetical protein